MSRAARRRQHSYSVDRQARRKTLRILKLASRGYPTHAIAGEVGLPERTVAETIHAVTRGGG